MEVGRLVEEDFEAYESFVQDQERRRIQHTPSFLHLINDTYRNAEPWHHVAREDGEIRAVYPFFRMKSRIFGTEIVSQPFVDSGGFLGDTKAEDIREIVGVAGETPMKVRLNTFMHNYAELEDQLLQGGFQKHVDRQQFIKELYEPDEMYGDLSDSTTRMVEEARENDLHIRDIDGEEDIEKFYPIYESAMKHFGTPQHPRSFFERAWERMYPGRVKGMNCYKGDEAIAMMICYTVGDYCYFIYNVSDPEYLDLRPNDFLYWNMMRWAAENGYKYFDFGQVQADAEDGTHAAGLYHFKQKWGPDLYDKPVFVRNKEYADQEYERAKKIWRRLPKPVTDLVGPFLASRKAY